MDHDIDVMGKARFPIEDGSDGARYKIRNSTLFQWNYKNAEKVR